MRVWSIDPRYLDRQGLTACWREALLAQAVLADRTRGYRSHPQLVRFRRQADPLASVGAYLAVIADAATERGYRFDRTRIDRPHPIRAAEAGHGPAVPTADGPAVPAADGSAVSTADGSAVPAADAPAVPAADGSAVPAADGPAVPTPDDGVRQIPVTDGQVALEWAHLRGKLAQRSPDVLARFADVVVPDVHPLFVVVPGPVEEWERAT